MSAADPNPDDGYGAYPGAAAAAFWHVTSRSSLAGSRFSACWCCGNSAGRWAQSRRCSSAGHPRSLRNSGSRDQRPLLQDAAYTGRNFLIGFVLALITGVPIGVLLGWYRRLNLFFDPFVNALYATPRIALIR